MTKQLPEGKVRKGGRNIVPDDFERPDPPPAFKSKLMTLPVFPNGYARQTVCMCEPKMIIPARTMIDGKWRLVCMTCGSFK